MPAAAPVSNTPARSSGMDSAPASYGNSGTTMSLKSPTQAALKPQAEEMPEPTMAMLPATYEEVVALFEEKREIVLWSHLVQNVELVKFETGRIEVHPLPNLPSDFAGRVGKHLQDWTGSRWVVTISASAGQPTLKAQADAAKQQRLSDAGEHPLVKKLLERFDGAKITDIKAAEILLEEEPEDELKLNDSTPQE